MREDTYIDDVKEVEEADVLFSDGESPAVGSITHINVSHDDDCPSLSGGQCNCDVDISKMEVF